jgi:4-amino-4-deoxy-L-arabinose transferase-like glycosyltransferase
MKLRKMRVKLIGSSVRIKQYLPEILFLLLATPILFLNLGVWTIQLWDESRLAISSYEMYRDGFSFIPTFQGGSDIHRSLPPLMVWLQTSCMHIFGVSEFALRFPSALFGVLIGWLLIYWTRRALGNPWIGFLAGLISVSTRGLNGFHGLHTGDYESALIFFLLLQMILFHSFVQEVDRHKRLKIFWYFVIAILLGVLTKGVQALFFTPAFFVYWTVCKGWKFETKRSLIFKSVAIIVVIVWYYVVREIMEPGYIYWVNYNELGGRYSTASSLAPQYPQFYREVLIDQLRRWVYLLPLALFVLLSPKQVKKNGSLLAFLCATIYIFIIENAGTKHAHYQLPIIPILSFLMVLGTFQLIDSIQRAIRLNPKLIKTAVVGFLVIWCSLSWFSRFTERLAEVEIRPFHKDLYTVTNWLREMNMTEESYDFVFLDKNYSAHNWWYIEQLVDKGSTIELSSSTDELNTEKIVLLYQKELMDALEKRFKIIPIKSDGHTRLVLLKAKVN